MSGRLAAPRPAGAARRPRGREAHLSAAADRRAGAEMPRWARARRVGSTGCSSTADSAVVARLQAVRSAARSAVRGAWGWSQGLPAVLSEVGRLWWLMMKTGCGAWR